MNQFKALRTARNQGEKICVPEMLGSTLFLNIGLISLHMFHEPFILFNKYIYVQPNLLISLFRRNSAAKLSYINLPYRNLAKLGQGEKRRK